jgi:hypothetical protein
MTFRGYSALATGVFGLGIAVSCGFDESDRWLSEEAESPALPACTPGEIQCAINLQRCERSATGPSWVTIDDCASRSEVCLDHVKECRRCRPGERRCQGTDAVVCDEEGNELTVVDHCDKPGFACRAGVCTHLCGVAAERLSNVGCEYWAVDLDNANVGYTLNAAAQQFAVVISNPQPDVDAEVEIAIEDEPATSGAGAGPTAVATAIVPPMNLRVFRLGPREVDGSAPGTFDTGTHTALTHAAYRIKSSVPVVAYQFNPLENVNVFSNDASLLKPVEALTDSNVFKPSYVVLGWPQTIASTDNPATNFNPSAPVDLRAFLTIVGTRPKTRVRVETTARVIGGGPIPDTPIGGSIEVELNPFDVLNLETDDFGADFTGSVVHADGPVAVFSGSEASDAPHFSTLAERRCCADHLEEQLDPIRTAGRRFVGTISESRTAAIRRAGGVIGATAQPEYFRVIAVRDPGAEIRTTLEGASARISLRGRGDWAEIQAPRDFILESDEPVMLGNVTASQDAAGVPRGLPGGDPSLIVIPPTEQFRSSYVFLTPDKYSFDFIRVVAPPGAEVLLDGRSVKSERGCTVSPADGLGELERDSAIPPFVVHRCQLSFPTLDPDSPAPNNLSPGIQNDGVHRVDADQRVGVIVDGFDAFVSYGYAAGTELQRIVPE